MRQASPTGGALGNVSNREIELLYSSWTQLNQDLPEAAVEGALNELMERYQRVKYLITHKDELDNVSHLEQAKMANEHIADMRKRNERRQEPDKNEGWSIQPVQ